MHCAWVDSEESQLYNMTKAKKAAHRFQTLFGERRQYPRACKKCEGNTGEAVEHKENSCDDDGMAKEFIYNSDRVSVGWCDCQNKMWEG